MILQILKKTSFLLCAGAMLVFSSCNGEETESIDAENTATETVDEAPKNQTDVNASEGPVLEGNTINGNKNTPIKINSEGGVNLNPPHGEPGHDCAIAVGQPLSSVSGGGDSPIINSSSNINPPHGDPGHDCAIAVGQPLN
jgi:hypothetical protein